MDAPDVPGAVDMMGDTTSATDSVTVGFSGGSRGTAFRSGTYYYREVPLDKGKKV